ncbi:hypothetical protein AGMMS49992_31260 [Clostridia bacterium]|nr:hypothetical protein AGMMS49992_31260 [Clostridia bacterium]
MGFTLSGNPYSMIKGNGLTFGHGGYGGAIGQANFAHGLAFGFTRNYFSLEGSGFAGELLNAAEDWVE